MFKHIVLIEFQEGYNPQVLESVIKKMDDLPGKVPQIVALSHGRNAGVTDDRYDYGLVAEFKSLEDYQIYISHPEHRALGAELNRLINGVAQIQFEC